MPVRHDRCAPRDGFTGLSVAADRGSGTGERPCAERAAAEVPEEPEDQNDDERDEIAGMAADPHDWTVRHCSSVTDALHTHDVPERAHLCELERPPRAV